MKKMIILVMLMVVITLTPTVFADSFSVSEGFSNPFSGYSLYRYERLDNGSSASASLYRVSGDLLFFKHIELDTNGLVITETDTLPLPPSEEGSLFFKCRIRE